MGSDHANVQGVKGYADGGAVRPGPMPSGAPASQFWQTTQNAPAAPQVVTISDAQLKRLGSTFNITAAQSPVAVAQEVQRRQNAFSV